MRTFMLTVIAVIAVCGLSIAGDNYGQDQNGTYLTIMPNGDRYQTRTDSNGWTVTTNQDGDRWTTIDHGGKTSVTINPDGEHVVTIRQ